MNEEKIRMAAEKHKCFCGPVDEVLRKINRERRKRLRRIALIEWGMYATMAGVVLVPIIGVAWKIWKMRAGGQP